MKIGIITFWQTQDNYGQVLQCYALQKYLISIGHDAYLIRYTHNQPKPILREKLKRLIKIYPVIKKIQVIVKKIFTKSEDQNIFFQRFFDDFRNQYIKQSAIIYRNLTDLQSNPPDADCYIVGSDQVWAQLFNSINDEIFFLNFGNITTKRISYAASFAMDYYPNKLLPKLAKNLHRFNAISVREKTGIRICKDAGYDAKLVLDPTLILKMHDYTPFIKKITPKKDYVYVYILNINSPEEIYWDKLKGLFHAKNYEIIATTASGYNNISFTLSEAKYEYPTIEYWLSLIYNSSLVITTSFHGVAFSICFNKPFCFFPLKKYAFSNNRIFDLLNELGLLSRVINRLDDLGPTIDAPIRWDVVNQKLEFLRKKSQLFLSENL